VSGEETELLSRLLRRLRDRVHSGAIAGTIADDECGTVACEEEATEGFGACLEEDGGTRAC
jgi:arginine repressor